MYIFDIVILFTCSLCNGLWRIHQRPQNPVHSLHDILQAGIVHPSFETTQDVIDWSDRRLKMQQNLCEIFKETSDVKVALHFCIHWWRMPPLRWVSGPVELTKSTLCTMYIIYNSWIPLCLSLFPCRTLDAQSRSNHNVPFQSHTQ